MLIYKEERLSKLAKAMIILSESIYTNETKSVLLIR
jgi:hypothetical protein